VSARSFNVYLFAMIKRPGHAFADKLIALLSWLRDHLNEGRWGNLAHVVLDPAAADGVLGAGIGDGRGFSAEELHQIRAHIDAGQLRLLNVDLNVVAFKYHRPQADYQTVQLLFQNLFDSERNTIHLPGFTAVFDPASALPRMVFDELNAHAGFIGIVPAEAEPSSKALRQLISWPPSGHWMDYLSAELVAALGGVDRIRALLPEHAVSPRPGGAAAIFLPLLPDQSSTPEAERLQDHSTAVMASHLPARF
jgi:hypothetical protein